MAFVVLAIVANAQSFSIKKGVEFKPVDNSRFDGYIDSDSSGVYLMRNSTVGKGITKIIQKLDAKTLKVLYSTKFELEKGEVVEASYLKNGKIMAFTYLYVKTEQIKYFLLREFNATSGKALGEQKKVASLESDIFGIMGRNFYASFSPDGLKMVITSEFKWSGKESHVEAVIYETATFKKIASKEIISAYSNSTISSFNYTLDNKGTFYYLFRYLKDEEEEITGLALARIPAEETKSEVTPLPFDKLDIQNGTFKFLDNKLVFCGVFKDIVKKKERKQGKVANVGVYSFFIDVNTGEITKKGFDYFSKEVSQKLTYKDGLIEENPAKKYYSFENIFTFNDAVYLIESHSYTISSNNSSSSYERELIVSKFNSAGNLEWMKIIPKFTANDLNTFNYIIRNNQVYLFYSEHPKNLEKFTVNDYEPKKYASIQNYNGSVLVCTTFDEKGNLSRKDLFRNQGWCYDPMPSTISLDKDNGLLLRMINKDMERYDKVTIE